MEWDLALRPEDGAQLSRLKLLAPLREGRARSRAVRIVWHDGPDAVLAKSGLALVERRGLWRLERMRPVADAPRNASWPPGTTPPVLAEAETRDGLAAALAASEQADHPTPTLLLPDPGLPWAAFEGRALTLPLRHAGGPVELTVLHGAIRTVMREHPVCRLLIHGPAEAATAIALQLAHSVGLAVPRASLAEEALAAARGSAAQPRALGAPELLRDFTVAEAFDHILAHLTDVILYWAPLAAAGDDGPEPVHQMRVATRRLRSAFAVFRRATTSPSVAEADAGLKALAQALGPARDWDVFNAGVGAKVGLAFDGERQEGQALAKLLAATERQRVAGYDGLRRFVAAPEFRQLGIRLAALAVTRPWETEIDEAAHTELESPLEDFAGAVLTRRWRRMFDAGEDIRNLETEELHRIRLRAKRLRYAAEFFAALFPPKPARRFIRRLSVLQEKLGTLNDGAVAASLLDALPGAKSLGTGAERAFAIGAVRGFVAASGGASRAGIAEAWKKFRKQEPFWT
jgi:CHAD domain-containing protein